MPRTAQQSFPLAISLIIHGVAFIALLYAPAVKLPRASESEYKQAIAGKENKIVWYRFPKELPRVSPSRPKAKAEPLRAETRSRQTIVSSPRNAPKRTQMVWTPAPELHDVKAPDSPNLLAIKLPELPAPPPRPFVTPPAPVRAQTAKVVVPEAPELKPGPTPQRAELKNVPLPRKAWVAPPELSKRLSTKPAIAADAPELHAETLRAAELPSMRLPPKSFVAPPAIAKPGSAQAHLTEAPSLAASTGTRFLLDTPKLPPKPFAPPPDARGVAAARNGSSEMLAPPVDLPANAANLNVAVVGLNPSDKSVPLPAAPSPADFSAGPKPRADGANSEPRGNGLSVPDLFVRGAQQRKPDLIAQAYSAPTSNDNLRAAMRSGEPVMTVHVAPSAPDATSHSGAAKVSGAPDPRFRGRDVYLMAIQMPNLTSYSGSWLMWYSDRTARETGLAPIAPPVPHRKVDPKYTATAVEERIEGRVQLACVIDKEGRVSTVELVRGIDERLNQSAEQALSKWEFYPATRSGVPVEVDVLVEIPFRLAPREPGK